MLRNLHLVSSTKDSLNVSWKIDQQRQKLQGLTVAYQAEGSNVLYVSHMLQPSQSYYDVTSLHENTFYNVCLRVFNNLSTEGPTIVEARPHTTQQCIEVSTTMDSLSVALGSTFGAFLALAVIIMFVFLAKWQHRRRLQKPVGLAPDDEECNEEEEDDDDVEEARSNQKDAEMSGISLHVNDDTAEPASVELSAPSSVESLELCECSHRENGDVPWVQPDVRPKDPMRMDFQSAYAPFTEQHQSPTESLITPPSLRVNWSCNW